MLVSLVNFVNNVSNVASSVWRGSVNYWQFLCKNGMFDILAALDEPIHMNIIACISNEAPGWWNWQTHTFEGRRPSGMGVQIPPPAYREDI